MVSLPPYLPHDSTNRGPTVKADEAALLRAPIEHLKADAEMPRTVTIPLGLYERLVHTAEKHGAA